MSEEHPADYVTIHLHGGPMAGAELRVTPTEAKARRHSVAGAVYVKDETSAGGRCYDYEGGIPWSP